MKLRIQLTRNATLYHAEPDLPDWTGPQGHGTTREEAVGSFVVQIAEQEWPWPGRRISGLEIVSTDTQETKSEVKDGI